MEVAPEIAEAIDCAITAGACWRAARATDSANWRTLAELEHAQSDGLLAAFLSTPYGAGVLKRD